MRKFVLPWLLMILTTPFALAGPPFFTDDPVPVSFRHYEFYAFSTVDSAGGTHVAMTPAFEFNVGAAPNLQLHIAVPSALFVENSGPATFGLGDIELGAKYRFIQENGQRPQVSFYPLIELPSGNNRRNLGNGQTWAKLPVWVQKSWGPWTSYGGAGYLINHAPGMRDHVFAGWQVQRELNKKLTLGAEWFTPGRDTDSARAAQLINAGGFYNFTDNLSLLFSGGHSVHGDSHTVGYFGLIWTWGPKAAEDKLKFAKSMHASHGQFSHPGFN